MMQLKTIVDMKLLFILIEKSHMKFFRLKNAQLNSMVMSMIF